MDNQYRNTWQLLWCNVEKGKITAVVDAPLWANIYSFFTQFSGNYQIVCWRPPPQGVGAYPLGNSGSATAQV